MEYSKFEKKFGKWADKFKGFIESPEMDEIYKRLKEDARNGENILPASTDTFRVFEKVNPDKLTAILFFMDPYPWVQNDLNVATGVALDCSNTRKIQPSLRCFYEGIEKELFDGMKLDYVQEPGLDYLLDQGIMLINSDLTVKQDKIASHKGIWKSFMKYFLEEIIEVYHPGVPIVLSGKNSQELKKYVNPLRNYILECEHPAAAARDNRIWETNGVFGKINKIIKDNNNHEIMWLYNVPF